MVTGQAWGRRTLLTKWHKPAVSWLLLGLPRPMPVARVSAVLDGMVKRIYEVIDVQVQGGAPLGGPLGSGAAGLLGESSS